MVTEIIEYKLKDGVADEEFLSVAEGFHSYFKKTFSGYIDLEFTKGEEGWINIMHWESMSDVKKAGEILKNSPSELSAYGKLVQPETTKLTFLQQKIIFK